jgi:hypothetical protein
MASPTTRVRYIAGDWVEVPRAIHAREALLGLLDVRGHERDPGLTGETIEPRPGFFVVRRGHPLAQSATVTLPQILSFPFFFIERVPQVALGLLAGAFEAARAEGIAHPAFPAVMHPSPGAALAQLPSCDAVVGMTLRIAATALRSGDGRDPGEAEQCVLKLLRDCSLEFQPERHSRLKDLGSRQIAYDDARGCFALMRLFSLDFSARMRMTKRLKHTRRRAAGIRA